MYIYVFEMMAKGIGFNIWARNYQKERGIWIVFQGEVSGAGSVLHDGVC